jgi:hypothetical protein
MIKRAPALEGKVFPQPIDCHDRPVPDAKQEINVGNTPEQPADKTL